MSRPPAVKIAALILALTYGCFDAAADQESPIDPDDCGNGTPAEIVRCNVGPMRRSEIALNDVVARYVVLLAKKGEVADAFGGTGIVELFQKTQLAWELYRNAECEEFTVRLYGRDSEWLGLNCLTNLNRKRAATLQARIEEIEAYLDDAKSIK